MAGFGAGFARALGTSLDAAGKSHLEEQRRAREYERAKADRQAERLEDRAWQQEDAATRRRQQVEDRDLEQGIKDEADWSRYSERDGKVFFTRRDGTVVEVAKDSPGANGYFRDKKEASQKDTLFGLTVSQKKADIRQSNAAAAASDARARADSAPKGGNEGLNALISSLAKNTEVTYAGGKFVREPVGKDGKETKPYYVPGQASADAVQNALLKKYGRGSGVTLRSIAQKAEAGDVDSYVFLQSIAPHLTFASERK